MKYISLFAVAILFYSCGNNNPNPRIKAIQRKDSLRIVVENLEKSYSELSIKKGFNHARIEFACDSSVELNEGAFPMEGKKAFEDYAASHMDSADKLQWKPVRAEVAASGEIGYTYGEWNLQTKTKTGNDTTLYGNYVTIWHRQPDGSWKFILDGGNNTPKPDK